MNKETLLNRNYKDISICQLDGCNNPILKKTKNKRNKYCCDEHAILARKEYKKLWLSMNKDKVKEWNRKYQIKARKQWEEEMERRYQEKKSPLREVWNDSIGAYEILNK